MSLKDQKNFISKIHPFEVLNQQEMEICIKNMDIAYYPKDSILISPEKISNYFFIIIKGSVYEYSIDNEVVIDYQEEDSFDSNSLIYSKSTNTFKVHEDLICYELEKTIFLKLIEQNQQFKNYFLKDLVNKIQTLKEKKYTSELSSFMISKVEDTFIHEPCIIDEDTTLINAIQKSMEYKTSSIIVKTKNKEYGIITDSILKTRVLLEGRDLNIAVKDIAKFPLLTVFNDDYLFEALTILIKKNIKRIGVINHNNEMIGILEQIDILSHFANYTYVVESKIKKAKNIDDLKDASENLINIIKNLHVKGVKVNHISNLIGQLNTKVYQKLYDLIVPLNLQQKACFVVMGSEGRNEQIVKTDQDNALIIKDNVDVEQFRPYMNQMVKSLTTFGYPLCEGKIMASNPFWCKTESEYKNEILKWVITPNMQNYVDLAIFFDSFAVAGDKQLLINLKDELFNRLYDKDVFMAYFAKATLTFDTPNIISSFITKKSNIDIKRTAIFPIVQGIRSLALKEKIKETTTIRRIKILENKKILEKNRAEELIEAFDFVNTLRLKSQLLSIQNGKKIDNEIDTQTLSKVERDLLKDSFKIVNEFKKFISYAFKIDKIS